MQYRIQSIPESNGTLTFQLVGSPLEDGYEMASTANLGGFTVYGLSQKIHSVTVQNRAIESFTYNVKTGALQVFGLLVALNRPLEVSFC